MIIAGHVSVPVKEELRPAHTPGRDVNKKKSAPTALQKKALRQIQRPVIIAQDGGHRRPNGPDRIESRQVTKITEVPYLVRTGDLGRHRGGKLPVSVGNNGNFHERWQNTEHLLKMKILCGKRPMSMS